MRSVAFHASPIRGAKLRIAVSEAVVRYLLPVYGGLLASPPAKTYAPGMPPAAGLGFVGSIIEYRFATSDHGVNKSQRRPRFMLSFGLSFQSSCTYRPVYQVRSPMTAS